jgi:hypothetical protein
MSIIARLEYNNGESMQIIYLIVPRISDGNLGELIYKKQEPKG